MVVVALEIVMAVAIYLRGYPGLEPFFRLATIWELPIVVLHAPAVVALTSLGMCCGYANDLVLGDHWFNVGSGSYNPMTLRGTMILGMTNLVIWLGISLAAVWLWRPRRRSRAV